MIEAIFIGFQDNSDEKGGGHLFDCKLQSLSARGEPLVTDGMWLPAAAFVPKQFSGCIVIEVGRCTYMVLVSVKCKQRDGAGSPEKRKDQQSGALLAGTRQHGGASLWPRGAAVVAALIERTKRIEA